MPTTIQKISQCCINKSLYCWDGVIKNADKAEGGWVPPNEWPRKKKQAISWTAKRRAETDAQVMGDSKLDQQLEHGVVFYLWSTNVSLNQAKYIHVHPSPSEAIARRLCPVHGSTDGKVCTK